MTSDHFTPVMVLTTVSTETSARTLAHALVNERLAACVSFHVVRSIYRWNGAIEESEEYQLKIKANARHTQKLIARIEQLHSYDVPEVLVLPISEGSAPYLNWMSEHV
jgi:periplasmic divalent cation tolerance protein